MVRWNLRLLCDVKKEMWSVKGVLNRWRRFYKVKQCVRPPKENLSHKVEMFRRRYKKIRQILLWREESDDKCKILKKCLHQTLYRGEDFQTMTWRIAAIKSLYFIATKTNKIFGSLSSSCVGRLSFCLTFPIQSMRIKIKDELLKQNLSIFSSII